MDAQTINQTFNLFALAQGDTKLKNAGVFLIGPCPFCGGRDRFNMKHTSEGWRWYCRKCGGDKYHGAIDYIMRRENLEFEEALELLGGDLHIRPREIIKPQEPTITVPDDPWQSAQWREIERASQRLLCLSEGQPGREYLSDRCLDRPTWLVNLLGFTYAYKRRPAIVIPWFDMGQDEMITAVKYRFIDDLAQRDKSKRFGMVKGSVQILFGLNATAGNEVLVLVEGEINAMSIKQTSSYELLHIDALSYGSESGAREYALRRVAQGYRRVIVWADDAEKAKVIRSALNRQDDIALCSPEIDGTKYDANALLQKGWLGDFLSETINQSGTH